MVRKTDFCGVVSFTSAHYRRRLDDCVLIGLFRFRSITIRITGLISLFNSPVKNLVNKFSTENVY